jgi:hypothetical protein
MILPNYDDRDSQRTAAAMFCDGVDYQVSDRLAIRLVYRKAMNGGVIAS